MIARHFAFTGLLVSTLAQGQQYRDYSLMDHRIFIDSLRAGNHDESGTNDYYFTLTLIAIRNTKEDLVTELEKRPVRKEEPLEFGAVTVKVLSTWKPEGKADENLFVDVAGDRLRDIVSQSMREYKVKEQEIALMATIKMWEKNKKFGYFGEDVRIAETKYFPIPASEYHAAARTNLKLNIEDDKGTAVVIKVRYKEPRTSNSAPKSTAAAASTADEQDTAKD